MTKVSLPHQVIARREVGGATEELVIGQSECSCTACQNMCRTSPCFPTPEQVAELIGGPHEDRFMASRYIDEAHKREWPIVAPKFFAGENGAGRCTFLSPENLCELHGQGLKPLEGRLVNHEHIANPVLSHALRRSICAQWDSELGRKLLDHYRAKVGVPKI